MSAEPFDRLRTALVEARPSTGSGHIAPGVSLKLRSSMTLFAHADPKKEIFKQVIDQYYDSPDPETELACNDSLIDLAARTGHRVQCSYISAP